MMYIPANKIISNQYTSGGEFINKTTNQPYKGKYYIMGSRYFTNSEPSDKSVEIIKPVQEAKIISIPNNKNTDIRYVVRDLRLATIVYKFVDETTYERLKNIDTYQTFLVQSTKTANLNAFKGLKEFLELN